jgi:hypothetical protein
LGADLVYLLLGGEPVGAAGESFSTIGKGEEFFSQRCQQIQNPPPPFGKVRDDSFRLGSRLSILQFGSLFRAVGKRERVLLLIK